MEHLFYLTEKEMREHPLFSEGRHKLHDFICRKVAGVGIEDAKLINPARINCSMDIYDASEQAFAEEHPSLTREQVAERFAMIWVNAGPHATESLRGPYCIYTHEGAIELKGE